MGRLLQNTISIEGILQSEIRGFKSDIMILSESQPLKDFVNSKQQNKIRYRNKLAKSFESFSKHRPIYISDKIYQFKR